LINKQFAFYDVPLKHDVFDIEEYKKSKTKFYATVTNVKTGLAEYIKLDDIIEQMEVLRATGAMPFVSKIVEYKGECYLDGALADSIPITKCMEMGYDKIIVVLTKPMNYRKKKNPAWIAKLVYRKYPKLVEAINNRYLQYNETMDKLEKLEKEGKIFVFRPSRKVDMSRVEKNPDKLQEMYDLGINYTNKLLKNLNKFLSK
jgi:predicted patatin/cPLA2 family phospholipase